MSRSREDTDSDIEEGVQPPRKRQTTGRDVDMYKYHHPGFIRSVECINFMCHKHLKVDVGAGITFVSGQNGHGKSAILTALIQVFSTDRKMKGERGTGSALRRNIEGNKKARSARIIVHINNKEADEDLDLSGTGHRGYSMAPFEPETYGDVIIIEREILEKSRKLRIMSADKTLISEKSDVLAAISSHFAYQFDNRLVIQTQENAKKRGDPKSLFDFFYNGSGFESIETDLTTMKSEVAEQDTCVQNSLKPATLAKKEIRDKLFAEVEQTKNTKKLSDELQRYQSMYKWLEYTIVQGDLAELVSSKVKAEDRYKHAKMVGDQRKVNLAEQKQILENTSKGDPELDDQLNKVTSELGRLKQQQNDIHNQLHSSKQDVKELKGQIDDLNKGVERLRRERDENSSNAEQNRLDAQIRQYHEQVVAAEEEFNKIQLRATQAEAQVKSAEAKSREAYYPSTKAEDQLKNAQGVVQRLLAMSKDVGNPIAPYGDASIMLDRKIQSNLSKFKRPPLGPIGQYIKLKPGTSELDSRLINSCSLAGMLRNYVVSSPEDERTLRSLLPPHSKITIYCMKPDQYNLAQISPPQSYKTVLSSLDISEDLVVQALVDWGNINTIGVFKEAKEGVAALKQGVRNLELAICGHGGGSRDYVTSVSQRGQQQSNSRTLPIMLRPGKAVVTPEEISAAQREVAKCEGELESIKGELRRLRQEEASVKRDFQRIESGVAEKDTALRQLRLKEARAIAARDAIPDAPTSDETDHQIEIKLQEVENSERQLAEARVALQASESRQAELTRSMDEYRSQRQGLVERKKQATEDYEEVLLQYNALEEVVANAHQKIADNKAKLDQKAQEVEQLQSDIQNRLLAAEALSKDPVPLDDNVPSGVDPLEYISGMQIKLEAKIKASKERNTREYRVVYAEYEKAGEEYQKAKDVYEGQKKEVNALRETEINRVFTKGQALSHGILQTSNNFATIMKAKAASAEIRFNLDTKRLEVKNYKLTSTYGTSSTAGSRDVATTSGGEHSFLQTALMAALWKMVDAPIICLDEYEVFMDDATRVTAQNNLVEALGSLKQRAQAILISPTVLKNSTNDDPRFVYVEVRDPSFAARN